MKGWIVEIGFRFSIGCDDEPVSNREIKSCLVGRLNAGGIQAHVFNVTRGKDQENYFIDLGGLEG